MNMYIKLVTCTEALCFFSLLTIDPLQCTAMSKGSLPQPCPLQSCASSRDKEDAEEVFQSDAVKNQDGKEGGGEVFSLAAALNQEAMEGAVQFHLAANREQELYSLLRESEVDVCITYTNKPVGYTVIVDCICHTHCLYLMAYRMLEHTHLEHIILCYNLVGSLTDFMSYTKIYMFMLCS